MQKIFKGLDWIENALAFVCGLVLLFMVGTVVLEVLSRYFFNHSYIWTMEMNEYSLLYIPFLGAAWLLRSNGHITVDILDNLLSDKPKMVLNIAVCLLGIAMSAVLFWYGAIISLEMLAGDIRSLTALKFPQFYVLSVIPIGSFVLMLEFLRKLVCLFKPEWLQSSANTDPVGV